MKALVLHGIGDIRLENVPDPVPKGDEVLLSITASGICGSDIPRIYEKGTYHFPTIPGHEFAGRIVQAKDADMVGKRAAVFPLLPCFSCKPCRIEEYAQCTNYNYFGSRCDGGFAEQIAIPSFNLVMIPDGVTDEEAAMCEPAAVAVHSLARANLQAGESVAIFGAGPIGLMLAQWASACGASKVFLVDIDKNKIAFAKKLNIAQVIDSSETAPEEAMLASTGGQGADICIEGAGASATLCACIKACSVFGRMITMGNPAGDMHLPQKVYWEILRKQLVLKGTWNSSFGSFKNDWQTALWAMKTGKINTKVLISHRYRTEQYQEAFDLMRNRKEFFNKIMFVKETSI